VEHGFQLLGLDLRNVAAVFLTHLHWDHARCRDLYPNARIFMNGGEATASAGERTAPRQPWVEVRDGQQVTAAGLALGVIGTPGHTPDSVSYVINERFLFTGDALRLRRGKVGPFPAKFNHDLEAVIRSIRKLARLPGIECLLTAHTGITCDLKSAFANWRESAPEVRTPEGGQR
jgi:glyoxylase-like metal-dependent hydrolase (beta-lactamase superfamily II)